MIRFRLGMFDPAQMVKYAQTPESALENPEHQMHALKMARQSMVLLRNEKNILPLDKNLKKIVVLGPNAANSISILGNYNGTPSKLTTVLQGIKEKVGANTEVIYERAINFTNDTLLVYQNLKNQYTYDGKQGFKAEYYNNKDLSGQPEAVRTESEINNFWQEGEVVVKNIKGNNFSARYTTNFTAEQDGSITFEVSADDGYRFLIDDKEVVNAWQRNRWGEKTFKLITKKNTVYKLVLEYWQGEGKANIALNAGNFEKTDFQKIIDSHKDADAFIYVGGISPQLEGEEMPVNFPGFSGGDRTSILLPKIQTDLMKALKTSARPVVFVMMTGSAIAIPWEAENIPAILNAWYGGQAAGTAVADILFGDYNPAGRLPVTFYKSDSDLPSFLDYSMDNKTYRYFKSSPLYGFGYGLSYTTFKYDQLKVSSKVKKGQPVSVSVRITNTGKTEGEEVAQLYLINLDLSIKAPLKSLKGFERINLKSGESKTITFTLSPEDLSSITTEGEIKQYSGKIKLAIGGSQPDEKNEIKNNIVTRIIQIDK